MDGDMCESSVPVDSIGYINMAAADGRDDHEADKPIIVRLGQHRGSVSADMLLHNVLFVHIT